MKLLVALLVALSLGVPRADAETVTLAADTWPPFVNAEHPEGGVSVQIIREALGRHGYQVELTIMPWARAMLSVSEGTFDALPDAWHTRERAEALRFSKPYMVNELRFLKRAGDDFQYQGLKSLRGKTVGTVRDYAYGTTFHQADFKREEVTDLITNIRKLARGRVDLAIADELVVRHRIADEAPELMDEIEFVETPYSTKELYLAVSHANPRVEEIIRAFNEGLTAMHRDGSFVAIMRDNNYPWAAPIN